MLLCHTPFKSPDLLSQFADKWVLVSGLGDMISIAQHYGYAKAIDIEELISIYPHIWPERRSDFDLQELNIKKSKMLQRLGMTEDVLKEQLRFSAIFLWSDAIKLE
jgi:hypothetical protein